MAKKYMETASAQDPEETVQLKNIQKSNLR